MNDRQTKRHEELSIIFRKMGMALSDEGLEEMDAVSQSLGSLLIYISSCVKWKKELLMINEFCNMMASKKLIEGIRSNELDPKVVYNMGEIEKLNMTDEELLNVITKLRNKLGLDNNDSTEKE